MNKLRLTGDGVMHNRWLRVLANMSVCVGLSYFAQACSAQGPTRQQAVLKLTGDFPPGGGFRLTEAPTSGPGASLELVGAPTPTKGILERGDIITRIAGKRFQTRREFMDLMNEAYRDGNGSVQITVRDVSTGREVNWLARPDVVAMQVPKAEEGFDFLSQLGPPVPKAPAVPKAPIVMAP